MSSFLLSSIKQLLPALHTRHGLHVLTPVGHLFLLESDDTIDFYSLVYYALWTILSADNFTLSSSFFTVFSLALKSDFVSLEVSVYAPSMSSVVFFTLFKLGRFTPFSSMTLWVSVWICATKVMFTGEPTIQLNPPDRPVNVFVYCICDQLYLNPISGYLNLHIIAYFIYNINLTI